MVESILLILGSLAVLVIGVSGNTHFEKKTGFFRRINFKGWLVIVAGILIAVVTYCQAKSNQQEIDWQKKQRMQIRKIAYENLEIVINDLIIPFNTYYNITTNSRNYSLWVDYATIYPILMHKDFIKSLDTLKQGDSVNVAGLGYNGTWGGWFSKSSLTFKNKINEQWVKWGLNYDAETIISLDYILRGSFQEQLEYASDNPPDFHPFHYENNIVWYLSYWDRIKKLEETIKINKIELKDE